MARTPDDTLRAALLDRAVDYVCEHGLSGLSLRPLAKAIDSSSGLLLYHFGSKDELLIRIIQVGRERQQSMMRDLESADLSPTEIGRKLWRAYSSPRWEPLFRLFFEVYALALQDRSRFPGFLKSNVNEWLTALEGPAPVDPQARTTATIILAAFRGFLLDFCATRERARVDRAVDQFFTFLDTVPSGEHHDVAS